MHPSAGVVDYLRVAAVLDGQHEEEPEEDVFPEELGVPIVLGEAQAEALGQLVVTEVLGAGRQEQGLPVTLLPQISPGEHSEISILEEGKQRQKREQ